MVRRIGLGWGCVWAAAVLSVLLPLPARASTGCVVTFRHGQAVRADRCEDQGAALAYLRFGGWVVVLKTSLTSVEEASGITHFSPPFTAEEEQARLRSLPKQGGVPIGPSDPLVIPPPPPPTVVYVPIPTPVYVQPVYEMPPPVYYPAPVVLCRHCRPHLKPKPTTSPAAQGPPFPFPTIGPMAVQRTFPSIVPPR